MNGDLQAAHRTLDAYKAAVLAKDVEAFAALYDEDVRVFDLWGQWSYEGRETWREMAMGWFGSLGDERVIVESDDVQAIVSPEMVVMHAFLKYAAVAADGQELRSMQNRLTWTLRQKDGAWRIVHEHTSAPVDPGTAKVILRR